MSSKRDPKLNYSQVIAAHTSSLVLCDTGKVYSCGENQFGELGLGIRDRHVFEFKEITHHKKLLMSKEKVIRIAGTGLNHFLITSNGRVFSFGWNNYGQLGIGGKNNKFKPSLISQKLFDNTKVIAASGFCHSLFLLENGCVYSCGLNWDGRIGRITKGSENSKDSDCTKPRKIKFPLKERIVKAVAGGCQSIFLTESGKVLTCGYGKSYQQCNMTTENVNTPVLITALKEKICIDISSGDQMHMFLLNDNSVFCVGNNSAGQCGIFPCKYSNSKDPRLVSLYDAQKRETKIKVPTLIKSLKSKKVVRIAGGNAGTLLYTSLNELFACGRNHTGKLGIGNVLQSVVDHPRKVIFPPESKTVKIVDFSISQNHSIFLLEDGRIYTCGNSKNGVLSQNVQKKDKYLVPTLVESIKLSVTKFYSSNIQTKMFSLVEKKSFVNTIVLTIE